VKEAFKYAKVRSKRELMNLALREFVEHHRRRNLMDLYGKGGI
jgi:Arc/MetJ family transcription regulator